jgi:spore maturation protein CgeB
MNKNSLEIVVLGLSITSSWGNGHATNYRGWIRELNKKGHKVTFLERDVPWYANNRDLPNPSFCNTFLYRDLEDLITRFGSAIHNADYVIIGSYVPEGVAVGNFVTETTTGVIAFCDIDTPVTLAKIERGDYEYLHPDLISRYDIYLSFTSGPTLKRLEQQYHSPMAKAFYCSYDPELYFPEELEIKWDLGYIGTYSNDRQPPLQNLMLDAALKYKSGKFVVAGPMYPANINWGDNVERIDHLPPSEHRKFYNSQRFTMNITRDDMVKAGFSPAVRFFEASACATPIISDYWDGLDSIFKVGTEVLVSKSADDTLKYLTHITEEERKKIGERARLNVMNNHTSAHRANELISYYKEALLKRSHQLQ